MSKAKKERQRDPKEWTVMFYFASDNPLALSIVSQLKAIKSAGYHHDVNVVAYFDPQPAGTPTHIFDVNAIYKLKHARNNIGFAGKDPYVRDLLEDRLWGDELSRDKKRTIRELVIEQVKKIERVKKHNLTFDPPLPPPADDSDGGPQESLQSFLKFCAESYPANHYMLFILGHGLVVGDDVFLYDEHAARHSVTLIELGEVLTQFKKDIKKRNRDAQFDLVSFHSCSMSSLEVAFQLQDTANYMLAAQGPAFVGSWPYRQILIRLFNDLRRYKTAIKVEEMLENIFSYVLYNNTDFMLAGYSFDLALCDLRKTSVVSGPLTKLSDALTRGLEDEMVRNCILLAHWKSQSYWQEHYTDFYDFCFCLSAYCQTFRDTTKTPDVYQEIQDKCDAVRKVLTKTGSGNPIIRAEYAGPDSQRSHGFSVFFPWTRPGENRKIMDDYERYNFASTGWFNFLNRYWGPKIDQITDTALAHSTMRKSRKNEPDPIAAENAPRAEVKPSEWDDLLEDMVNRMFNTGGLNPGGELDGPVKPDPRDATGDGCTCGSIKNYLRDTRKRNETRKDRGEKGEQWVPFSPSFFKA